MGPHGAECDPLPDCSVSPRKKLSIAEEGIRMPQLISAKTCKSSPQQTGGQHVNTKDYGVSHLLKVLLRSAPSSVGFVQPVVSKDVQYVGNDSHSPGSC